MRLRLPTVLARGGDAQHGSASAGTSVNGEGRAEREEAEGTAEHAPVPDDREQERRQRAGAARAVGGGLLALCSGAAARGARLAHRLWWLPGWVFAAITQAPAVLAVAWLVPGAVLLLAGRLLPLPMVIIFVPLAVALCYFAMRRMPVSWPRGVDAGEAAVARRRPDVPAGAVLAMVVIAAGFGVWQALLRSEQVFVVSDPGVYLQSGYWIAGHGAARIPESAAAFGGSGGLDFATPGFIVSGGWITPEYLPGLPLVLAGGTWLGGLGGALLMPAVLGGCAVLSFAGLAGRLCGMWWGVAGELVLALCLPEVYASRTPFSEPLVQVLMFGGLCLFLDSLVVRRRGVGGSSFMGGAGRHGRPGKLDGELALAGLGGVALGLTVLASVGSLGMLLPTFPVVAALFAARRPQAGPFGGGLLFGIGTGLVTGLVVARPYLASVAEQLRPIGLAAAVFGVVTALIAPLALPGAPAWVRRAFAVRLSFPWFNRERVVFPSLGFMLGGLALVLPVLVLAGLAVRPYLQTVHGQTNAAVIRQVAALQRLERLPVDGTRQYYESSLSWLVWYLGVPALLLACLGAAALGRRLVRAVLSPRPAGLDRADFASADPNDLAEAGNSDDSSFEGLWLWGLPFLVIAWSVLVVLWDPAVIPWQPLASHRLVPMVLPGLALLAVWASSRLTARAAGLGASRPVTGLVAAFCVLALATPPLMTTLNPGLAGKPSVGRYSSGVAKLLSRMRLRGVGVSATYGGSVAAASSLCAAIGPSASVLFVDEQLAETFAPVVRGLCGQPAAWMVPGATSTASVTEAVDLISQLGRRPVVIGPSRAAVSLSGMAPRLAVSLSTSVDAEILTGPPAGTWPAAYSLWLAASAR